MTGRPEWRNRIVGHGEEAPGQLLANPANWRIHPKAQQDALAGVLDEVGWVQDIIVNQRTGHVVDGHLRVSMAISREEATVPVKYVDLSDDEERLVLASLDPLAAMAVTDEDMLAKLTEGIETDSEALQALLAGEAYDPEEGDGGLSDEYSRKIEAPIYEVTGDKPAVDELLDESKTEELRAEIMDADIPDDIRRFLLAAAERHTVFRFASIAEFYAHSDAHVQRLMERSALVIVDFDRAIEEGFAKLAAGMMQQAEEAKEAREAAANA